MNRAPENNVQSTSSQDKSIQTTKKIPGAVAVSLYEDSSSNDQRKRRRAVEQYLRDMRMFNFQTTES